MIWLSPNLVNKILNVEILPKTFSDHNPVQLVIKFYSKTYRWRLDEAILRKKEFIEDCKKKLNEFFEVNLDNEGISNTQIKQVHGWHIN